jgi:hypothetical protein
MGVRGHLPPPRHRGGKKALWVILAILIPFFGALIYLISQSSSISDCELDPARQQRTD